MNKLRFPLIILLMFLLSGIAWVKITHAQSFLEQTGSSQVINSSLYSAGQNVDVEGTVNGDVYCAGQNVTIDATVHGDVICAGQTVTVDGHIDGSVRVAAQTFTDGAKIGHSLSVITQNTTITKTAIVDEDATFAGQQATINGTIGRDIAAASSTFSLNGKVGRNVKFTGTSLSLLSSASVAGNLDYNSQESASIASSAKVHGNISHTKPAVKKESNRATFASWAESFMYFFAAMLLFGAILTLLAPQAVRALAEEPQKHLGRALLNGLGLFVLEPIVIVGLVASVIGIPLAFICVVLFLLLAAFTIPVTAFYIGEIIMSSKAHAILTMTVGTFALTLLLVIPVVGVFVAIASFFIGLGGIVLAVRKYLPSPVYKVK